MAWLKTKWQWLVVGLVVLVAFIAGRGTTADEIRKALAFRKLRETDDAFRETVKHAAQLDARADALAHDLLVEQVRVEAEREKLKHAPDSDVDAFLVQHGAVRRR